MTLVERLGEFVADADYGDLSAEAVEELKKRVLDALGCAVRALEAEPVAAVGALVEEFGGEPLCTLVGGGRSAPDRAALYNGALVRYPDYNDSFLAPGETCHPSDNLGAVLAAAEHAGAGGEELLAALAVSYAVQCRLSEVAPVRSRGFDHTVQGAYGAAAGVSKALGLDAPTTANAVAISGTANNALRVTRTGALSHWKGLAAPNAAAAGLLAAYLAGRGITGPSEVFEGNKGFMETVAGEVDLKWEKEDLGLVRRTIVKRYNAEVHSQSALEAALELREEHGLTGEEVEGIELRIFRVAYDIIGGGEEGEKYTITTKEAADHSLPYMLAVALLDGEVTWRQYTPARISSSDVQGLLRRVVVRSDEELSRRFPHQMPAHLRLRLKDGRVLEREKSDYAGFFTRPANREQIERKFHALSSDRAGEGLRTEIAQAIWALEDIEVRELAELLARAGKE